MNVEININQLLSKLTTPTQDLSALSFAATNRASSVKAWVEALPATRITHTGVLLYKALPEINRIETTADNRLAMLEAVRPYVQHCIQGLAKGFLNQPLILPEGPLKTAVVAQALQKHMSAGYISVVVALAKHSQKGKVNSSLEQAIHRSISGLGLLLLRGYQLYRQIPSNLWLELHTVYLLAEYFDIQDRPIRDQLLQNSETCTISQAYLRILLLACARPNQMRQIEVSATYDVLESWAYLAKLQAIDHQKPNNLFLVNLSADMAPLNKSRFNGNSQDDVRELDITALINSLQKQREMKESGAKLLEIPTIFSNALLDHLEQAWSVTKQRAFERHASNATIETCVGLSNVHHHIINGMSFEEFLGGEDEEIEEIDFGAMGNDPWNNKSDNDEVDDQPTTFVHIIDTSPGGYCLEWRDQIPAHVRAGEVIGLREKGRHRWGLGVIRWVQQQSNATRLGIQLLAPKTTPYAAAIEMPAGDHGDFMRVLMLPELKAANQPATLITAYAPFQEFNRIRLNNFGELSDGQLTRRIFSTGSITQFTFRAEQLANTNADSGSRNNDATNNAGMNSTKGQNNDPEDFDSVWDD